MATTNTYTSTYARLALVQINIRAALRSLGWSSSSVDKLVDIGLATENRYVAKFHTYGVSTESGRWQLHSWIGVDWDEHSRMVVTNSIVSVDDRWINGENPGLIEQADGFARLLSELRLDTTFAYELADNVSADPDLRARADVHMSLSSYRFTLEADGGIEFGAPSRLAGLGEVSFGTESAFPD